MNKTLKVLLTVVLFAVVLLIANSVNAATLQGLAGEATPTVKLTEDTNNTYELTANTDIKETLVLSAGQTLDLKGFNLTLKGNDDVPAIEVKGNAKIKGTGTIANESTSKAYLVKVTSGTLTIDGGVLSQTGTVKKVIENAGTVILNAGTVASIDTAGTVIANSNFTTINATANSAIVFVKTGATGTVTKAAGLSGAWSTTGWAAKRVVNATTTEAGKVRGLDTAIEFKTTVGGKEYTSDTITVEVGEEKTLKVTPYLAEFEITQAVTPTAEPSEPTDLAKILTFASNVVKGIGEGTAKYTYTLGAKTKELTINVVAAGDNKGDDENQGGNEGDNSGNQGSNGENQGNQGSNGENQGNQGSNDENQGTNNEENKGSNNEKELDPDQPDTGDHIIPATALLAVVVVANVVYFAKMKRN